MGVCVVNIDLGNVLEIIVAPTYAKAFKNSIVIKFYLLLNK